MKAAVTFCLVLIGWVFFRAVDLPENLRNLQQMFHGGPRPMETRHIE